MTELSEKTESDEMGRDETRIYRESRPGVQRHRFEHMNTLIVGCASASVALLILTTLQWFSPHVPLLVYLGLIVLPASLYVVWRGHTESLAVLRTLLVYAMLLCIPFVAWNVSPYRSAVYYLTGWALPKTTLLVAVKERSELVAVQACVQLLGDEALMEDAILPTLRVRAAVAAECLERVSLVDHPKANSIGRTLYENWYEDLAYSASVPAENGCAIAESLNSVAQIAELEGAPTLLHCALSSPQAETAQCCASVLSTQFPADSNPDVRPGLLNSEKREALFGELTRMANRSAERLLENSDSDSALRWPPSLLLHWTARIGCNLVERSEYRDRFAGELASITGAQCGLDIEKSLHTFETVTLIKNTCEPFLEKASQGDTKPVTLYDWCASARIAARSTAAEAASFAIHQSISIRDVGGLADSIDWGVNKETLWKDSSGSKFLNEFNEVYHGRADAHSIATEQPGWARELKTVANRPTLTPAQERAQKKRIDERRKQILSSMDSKGAASSEPQKAGQGSKRKKK